MSYQPIVEDWEASDVSQGTIHVKNLTEICKAMYRQLECKWLKSQTFRETVQDLHRLQLNLNCDFNLPYYNVSYHPGRCEYPPHTLNPSGGDCTRKTVVVSTRVDIHKWIDFSTKTPVKKVAERQRWVGTLRMGLTAAPSKWRLMSDDRHLVADVGHIGDGNWTTGAFCEARAVTYRPSISTFQLNGGEKEIDGMATLMWSLQFQMKGTSDPQTDHQTEVDSIPCSTTKISSGGNLPLIPDDQAALARQRYFNTVMN